jgi:hypothetical protein
MFSDLISTAQRVSDDFVNVTIWCKKFGKTFYEFKRIATTEAFIESLTQNVNTGSTLVIETKRGKGGGTWVHPLLAIKLAEWLSPDFEVFVKQTFAAYLKADMALADSIVERSDDLEAIVRHNTKSVARQKQLEHYHGLMGELKGRDCEAKHLATVNKHNNQFIGVESRKDGLTTDEVSIISLLENFEQLQLSRTPGVKKWGAVNTVKDSGTQMMSFLKAELLPALSES